MGRRAKGEAQKPSERRVNAIIGVGSSAGGLEACSQLLAHLPVDQGLAVIIIQHQEPGRSGLLAQVLGRATGLPVVEAHDQIALEPDRVYVMPPGVTMQLANFRLVMEPAPRRGGSRPIDSFFCSLAEELQQRSVGVVLSGTGSDGTNGLEAIKSVGGITFAQDEVTARWAEMPSSALAAGAVDICLAPAEIGRELGRLAAHPFLDAGDDDGRSSFEPEPLARLLAHVRKHTGVDFTRYKPTTISRRIRRRMMMMRTETLAQYFDALRTSPAEVETLYQDLLISVTGLFRDPEVYDFLCSSVLPELLLHREPGHSLRIWVPGCSRGDEVYSMAICVLEVLGEAGVLETPVQLFGTDINERAVERARSGMFPEAIADVLSEERLKKYFNPVEGGYQIRKQLRDLCTFARHDLTSDPPFSRLDLISCRNVLIYLGAPWQERILRVFHYALKPHGVLLLGTSEALGRVVELYSELDKRLRFYAKRPAVTALEPELALSPFVERPPPSMPLHLPATGGGGELQREADRLTLARYAPAGVIVNELLDVVQFRGRTGQYLEPPPGNVTHNLLNLAREGLLADLRSAVHEALLADRPVRRSGIRVKTNGSYAEIELEVVPLRCAGFREKHLLVLFEPASSMIPQPVSLPPGGPEGELQRLQMELSATRDYLVSLTQQHDAANEDLKAAYEEIQSANEELQSTNEELETAKEELQSTNEELTTLNEELCDRNLELIRANNDLNNLLSSVNIPVMILGADLSIRRFTSVAEKFLNVIPSDVGRGLGDLRTSTEIPDLEERIQEVIDTLLPQEVEVQDRAGRWYSLRIRPYRTAENRIDGALVAFVDVDPLKRGLEAARESSLLANAVLDTLGQPLLVLSPELRVQQANRSFHRMFATSRDEVEGRSLAEVAHGELNLPEVRALLREALDGGEEQTGAIQVNKRKLRASARTVKPSADASPVIVLTLEERAR